MKGFTLIETLIALTITILISGLLLATLLNSTNVYQNQSKKIEQGLETNTALSTIRENIKTASSVVEQYQIGSQTFISDQDTLVLSHSSIDSSGNIISAADDYLVFTVDDKFLQFKLFAHEQSSRKNQDQILTKNVDNIVFEYFDSDGQISLPKDASKVKATIVVSQKDGLNQLSLTATSEATLRNN